MTWRARIDAEGDLFLSRSVRLLFADIHANGTAEALTGFTTDGAAIFTHVEEGVAVPSIGLQLPVDALPAILSALSSHLGAVEHPEQLRRDYDAERARVDKLIGHLIGRAA